MSNNACINDKNDGVMLSFKDELIASSGDGETIKVEANVASILGPKGNLVKNIQSVSIKVNIPVNDKNEFIHPENGKTYIVDSNGG